MSAEEFAELMDNVEELGRAAIVTAKRLAPDIAQAYWTQFEALKAAGFSEDQALKIVVEMDFSNSKGGS